ncbi:uncharacterized protein GBIM_17756, partial [Gryllus bimaculatus]
MLDGDEEDEAGGAPGAAVAPGLKRSHEMIFQPEPRPLAADSPESESSLPDERLLASSLEDGSLASVRTVIEASPRGASPVGAEPHVVTAGAGAGAAALPATADSGTSTAAPGRGPPLASVTITTSSVAEHGVQSVCTQVTSQARASPGQTNGPTQVDFIPEYDLDVDAAPPGPAPSAAGAPTSSPAAPRRPGHRRTESRIPVPTAPASAPAPATAPAPRARPDDRAESDGALAQRAALTLKETRSDERKDVDEAEPESYHTEADQ